MRIGYDLRPFLRAETGVGTYLRNLLFQLARFDTVNEYYLFSASWKDRFLEEKIPPLARKKMCDRRLPVRLLNFFWYRWPWPRLDWFFGTSLDLTHSATPLILPTRGKKIITIYDLYFLDSPQRAGVEAGKFFFRRVADSIREADGVITFSRFTREEMIARFDPEPAKIEVILPGLDPAFEQDVTPSELERVRQKFRLPPAFLLFVGAQESRKNLLGLLDCLAILHRSGKKIPLVLVGPAGLDSERLQTRAKELELSGWVRQLGYMDQTELRSVYRLASAFVFPSFREGFGFPLLEAMASGLPVVASTAPAIPEVCGDGAVFFNPEDAEEMARQILLVLDDIQAREGLVARGRRRAKDFSWEAAARHTLAFYHAVMERGS